MKRLLCLLFAFAVVFTACNKDDDGLSGDEGTLVGAWKIANGSSVWVFLENGTCYAEDGSVGTWHYYVPSSTGGDYKGFLTTEYVSAFSGKGYTTNWWVVSVSKDKWIGTNVSGDYEYIYNRIELNKEKYKEVEQTTQTKNDEGVKITLSYTKNSGNNYTCTVKLSGDVESEDVSEIGVRFAPTSSSDEPYLLFANPSNGTLSYSTSRTLAISEKVMGYAIVKGKTYKTNIQTITITANK